MAILGIDLGTTNSLACVWKDGKAELVKNSLGEFLTPSVVCLDGEGNLTVGAVAGFLLAPAIMTQFRRDDALVIAIGTRTFRYQCCTLPLGAVLVFANMFFQSLGKSWRAVLLAICRQGLYIPLVYLMSGRFGLTGLECTQAVADLLAFALSAAVIAHYFKTEFGKEG